VYIDSGDKAKNEQLFNCLLDKYKGEIEATLGFELSWEILDQRRACRIAAYREGDIDVDSETLVEIKRWAIENLLKFKAIFPDRIRKCSSLEQT